MSIDSKNTQFMIELNHFQKYIWQLRDMFDTDILLLSIKLFVRHRN